MISYGEGRIAKSIDQGHTWSTGAGVGSYVYKVIYDPQDPNILYATGDVIGEDENVKVFWSTDAGETWQTFDFFVPDSDGAMDIQLYEGKLFLYTLTNGVYAMEPELLNIQHSIRNDAITIYPNPVQDKLHIFAKQNINSVTIHDISGKIIRTYFFD